ncbi:hypothetical protein EDM56_09540 [Brevibacillus fluminis]|uniref:YvaD family protein n=1 Tax=Brevibacillus fluminis TaxID=511487 RepID=A0A3M8DMY0_9BACL|nr:DUF5360 family protein [Brevibacillus fluminis]RNB89433.1 hypothetical protein EDM56_09540 [Brevibacillus fluminis]
MSRSLKGMFLFTDIGFVIYWVITYFELIPKAYLYQDYKNSLLVAWNWSFFPLDMFISMTGMISLYMHRKMDDRWRHAALISLILTFCSGLQAIVFWVIRLDFDPAWWIPNLFLLLYPLFFIRSVLSGSKHIGQHGQYELF